MGRDRGRRGPARFPRRPHDCRRATPNVGALGLGLLFAFSTLAPPAKNRALRLPTPLLLGGDEIHPSSISTTRIARCGEEVAMLAALNSKSVWPTRHRAGPERAPSAGVGHRSLRKRLWIITPTAHPRLARSDRTGRLGAIATAPGRTSRSSVCRRCDAPRRMR